jgi:hypothetical protein
VEAAGPGRVEAAGPGRVEAAGPGRVEAAGPGRVEAAGPGRVEAAGGRVPVLAGRVVAAAPAAGGTAHFTAVSTTHVKGPLAATTPTVTWREE